MLEIFMGFVIVLIGIVLYLGYMGWKEERDNQLQVSKMPVSIATAKEPPRRERREEEPRRQEVAHTSIGACYICHRRLCECEAWYTNYAYLGMPLTKKLFCEGCKNILIKNGEVDASKFTSK